MSDKFTAKNWPMGRAPRVTTLKGDKTAKAEAAQHVIEFPGGAIEVTRTTDGNYWAHIIVNQQDGFPDGSTRESARGEVIGSRVQTDDGLREVAGAESLTQIAVLIRPTTAKQERAA